MVSAIHYQCTVCQEQGRLLTEEGNGLCCQHCGRFFARAESICQFDESTAYYSDLPAGEMEALIQEAKKFGWYEAVRQRFAQSHPLLFDVITQEERADWQWLLPAGPQAVALDVGAGWGTLSIPLARRFHQVVSLDGTMDRLRFLAERASQEGLENISLVQGNILCPPLGAAQFDLVVLSGVLEWVPESRPNADPQATQLECLQRVQMLLRPGGALYLTIENRCGLKYMLGEPDDHTGLPYSSYLPREEASLYSERMLGRPYRTYTYGMSGYRSLLAQAGFDQVDFYYPLPDYKRVDAVAPLGDLRPLRYLINQLVEEPEPGSRAHHVLLLERALSEREVLGEFVSAYGIIARVGSPRR